MTSGQRADEEPDTDTAAGLFVSTCLPTNASQNLLMMDKDRNHMTEQILKLTLEIIYLLTGEDYAPVSHSGLHVTRGSVSQKSGSSRWTQSLTMNNSSSRIHETKNDEKILTLTNKITELLRGEVPIRYEDIMVCFSVEEWEYVEGHKDLYKYVLDDQEQDNGKDLNKEETKSQDDQDLPSVPCINKDTSAIQTKAGRKAFKWRKSQKRRAKYISKHKPNADDLKNIPKDEKPPEVSAVISQSATNEDGNLPSDATNAYNSCLSSEIKPSNVNYVPNDHTQEKNLACQAGQQLNCPEGISTVDNVDVKPSHPEVSYCIRDPSMDTFVDTSCAQAQYLYTHIKEESVPVEADSYGLAQYPSTHDQEESWQKASDTCANIYAAVPNQYTPADIKKESVLCEEENYLNSSIHIQPDHMQIQYTPKQVKEEPISQEEGYELYIPTDSTQILHTSAPVQAVNRMKDAAKTSKRFPVTKYRDWNKTPEKAVFVNHRTTKPDVDGIYICSTCDKSFTSHFGLVKHQAMHNGNKVSCPQCGKLFFYKSSLVIHQRIHTGEKLFACSVCNKCFTNNSNLVVHQRIHTGEKPFVCSECGKRFGHKGHLNRHLRTHETEKPATNIEKYVNNRLQDHWNSHKRNGWSHNIYDTGAYCMYGKSV
ncbi:uncharacterized protein ACNLHF_019848 [Anomaloglossus baeobatrachus]|uniref:uncharacterized protein LOC142311160 n=1 Tax=Anomaloglossus baeobatrachus TaxID=238106 RepID=UPI003F50408D